MNCTTRWSYGNRMKYTITGARAALGVSTVDSSCPLTQLAARLLAHGRRSSTKHSYCGKWRRFVEFYTDTLPQLYLQRPRRPLPASSRTVFLYLAHLSDEGLVSESSLNPYMAAINQKRRSLLGSPSSWSLFSSCARRLACFRRC